MRSDGISASGHVSRSWLVRAGDAIAVLVVGGIFLGGFLSHGYVDTGWIRLTAWMGCAFLGGWSAIGFVIGRWSGERMATARMMMIVLLTALLLALLQLVPLNAGVVQRLSPVWRGICEAFAASGIPIPEKLTLAVAPENAWASVQHIIAATLFFAGVAILANHRSASIALIIMVTGVSMVEGFFGLFNYLVAEAFRASGSVYNPNHFAVIVIVGLPLYFTALMEWKRHSEIMSEEVLGGRNPILIFVCLGVVALLGWVTALSRSSVIITTFVVGIWLMLEAAHWRKRDTDRARQTATTLIVGGTVALGLFFVGSLFFQGVFDRMFAGDAMGGNSRVKIWAAALRGLQESNYLGVGLGGTQYSINRFAEFPLTTEPIWAHSDVIQWLCDFGVPGFLILAVLSVILLRGGAAILRDRREHFEWSQRRMQRAAIAGVTIAMVHAFLDFHLRIPQVGFMVLTLVALTLQPGLFKILQKAKS